MRSNQSISHGLMALIIASLILFIPFDLAAEDINQSKTCIDYAIDKIMEIRSLPEQQFLRTLDNQNVPLDELQYNCSKLYPKCILHCKFYYLPNEIREIFSTTENGLIKHKIRCYYNYLSLYCPDLRDVKKIYGDVAEFYDSNNQFLGLSVYMGDGMYCPLKYSAHPK